MNSRNNSKIHHPYPKQFPKRKLQPWFTPNLLPFICHQTENKFKHYPGNHEVCEKSVNFCGLSIGTNGIQWYERSGQICNIWFRGTKCLANTGLSHENFLYTHNTYLHPDLLQSSPKVQLMGMTSKEVCFSIPNNQNSSGNMG